MKAWNQQTILIYFSRTKEFKGMEGDSSMKVSIGSLFLIYE
jgi:hypothetical protein